MTSVPPHRIRVPLLLGGPHAAALEPPLMRTRLRRQGRERRARRRLGHQDVPQRDDQGPRGDGDRGLHRRAPLRRRRRGARIADKRPSPASIGRSRAPTSSSASSSTAAAAARRCARSRSRCARSGSNRGAPPAPPSARPGSPTWPMRGVFGASGEPRLRAQRRLAHRGRPHPRAARGDEGRRAMTDVRRRPRAGSTGTRPEQAAVQAAARQRRRALPRVRPGRRSFPTRPSASTRRATPARSSCSRCATTSASRATSIVQATCHGADNRAMVDALPRSRTARRAASPPSGADVTDAELAGAARRRRARRALQLRQAPGRLHAARTS